ncbi:AAA family ATPase [Caldalkalibacillus salinus]|uniref:AAA family ATPase n=1 Tax=Caldalkalibacillus salinus TaxID=2803787 RepID=UPI001921B4E2|nr:AAA family ATPase [Caldalkalibacillus salinus]
MIVMINGAFGAGKTTAANMLHPFIANNMIFDPEEIGYMLRKIVTDEIKLKEEKTDDFQDMELWRVLVVNVAKELKRKYNKHLIVPMTIYKHQNFEYIYNGLKDIDKDIYHFCLIASNETLHARLTKRGDTPGGWTFQQNEKCVDKLKEIKIGEHIFTDQIDSTAVANRILSKVQHDV